MAQDPFQHNLALLARGCPCSLFPMRHVFDHALAGALKMALRRGSDQALPRALAAALLRLPGRAAGAVATPCPMSYRALMRLPAPALHGILLSLPLLAVLIGLSLAIGSEADILWTFRVHKAENLLSRKAMFLVSDWANWSLYAVWLALLINGLRNGDRERVRLVLWFVAMQLLVNLVIVSGVKMALGRPRPLLEHGMFQAFTSNPHYHSLPSGHTAEITGATMPLALWRGKAALSLGLGLLVAATAFSRIYLYEHYPTDVLFGWAFGAFAGSAAYSFGTRR
jgi:undecaprenyl-diphosphatase